MPKGLFTEMNKIKAISIITTALFISACTPSTQPKPEIEKENKPEWVKHPENLNPTYAVGVAPVNFQGLYIQRLAAISQAKGDLSQSLSSYISTIYTNEAVDDKKVSRKSSEQIDALSETFLHDSYQIDGYIDNKRNLYVLIYSPNISNALGINTQKDKYVLNNLNTEPFNKEDIINSRCYSKAILESINTKAALYLNKPVWFFRPNQDGYIGSVGIAEKEYHQSFQEQKRIAVSLSKSSLSKRQRTKVRSEHEILKILNGNTSGHLMETSSITRSGSKVKPSKIKDIWLDPKSCELYIWSVAK